MSTDPTKYSGPLEPTQGVYYNPYDPTPPYYGDMPPIPPPPPTSQGHKRLILILVSIICLLIVVLGGVLFAEMRGSSQPGNGLRATPIPTNTVIPTLMPTTPVAPTPTPTAQSYDAMRIIQDFQAHRLPLDQLQYRVTINQFVGRGYDTVITTQSSAEFIDPSFCTGPCGAGSVWLGVYNSPVDTQSEYNGLLSYRTSLEQNGPGPGALASMVQAGRCLMIGEPATSEYAAILRSDCT